MATHRPSFTARIPAEGSFAFEISAISQRVLVYFADRLFCDAFIRPCAFEQAGPEGDTGGARDLLPASSDRRGQRGRGKTTRGYRTIDRFRHECFCALPADTES